MAKKAQAEHEEVLVEEVQPPQTGIAKLSPFEIKLADHKKLKALTIAGPSDKEGYKKVEEARKTVKKDRISMEKVADEMIRPLVDIVDQIRSKKKSLIGEFKDIEDDLDAKSDAIDTEIAAEKARKEKEAEERFNNRMDQVQTLGAKWNGFSSYKVGEISITTKEIQTMSDEAFIHVTDLMEEAAIEVRRLEREAEEAAAEIKKQQEKAAAELAEANRILEEQKAELEKQRLKFEADKKRLEEEAAAAEKKRIEDKRIADEKAEVERKELLRSRRMIQLEKITKDIEEDEDNRILAYKGHILLNTDDLVEMDEVKWADMIEGLPEALKDVDRGIEEEEKEKKEAEAMRIKAAEDAAVLAQKKKEESEKKEKERQAKLQPDKQQFAALCEKLNTITDSIQPATAEGKKLLVTIEDQISKLSIWITDKTKSL